MADMCSLCDTLANAWLICVVYVTLANAWLICVESSTFTLVCSSLEQVLSWQCVCVVALVVCHIYNLPSLHSHTALAVCL